LETNTPGLKEIVDARKACLQEHFRGGEVPFTFLSPKLLNPPEEGEKAALGGGYWGAASIPKERERRAVREGRNHSIMSRRTTGHVLGKTPGGGSAPPLGRFDWEDTFLGRKARLESANTV